MPDKFELPEPSAHMYPSDLEKFKNAETFAQAYSVAVGNPDERSVPLYTLADMVAYAEVDRNVGREIGDGMTPRDLIDDLRSRIKPAYAAQVGTESYERLLCAEALEAQADEIERLRAEAREADALRDGVAEIEQLRLAEEGAKEAFGHVVQQKRDLEKECKRLRGLLDGAYETIRRQAHNAVDEHAEQTHRQAREPLRLSGRRQESQTVSAQLQAKGKYHYVGTYDTPELAHAAYVEAKRELHKGNTL